LEQGSFEHLKDNRWRDVRKISGVNEGALLTPQYLSSTPGCGQDRTYTPSAANGCVWS